MLILSRNVKESITFRVTEPTEFTISCEDIGSNGGIKICIDADKKKVIVIRTELIHEEKKLRGSGK